ncbi:MAG TPA: ParB/Srx family N-terminal domain-containing protein [Chryseolinea sp.]
MLTLDKSITISKEIRDYIIPLADEELFQLEKNILSEGCREPLIVWEKSDGQLVLVDGHNRYKICQKNNLPFKIKKVKFKDQDDVKVWMVDNQIGRRNLTPDQSSYYRGLKYLSLKKKRGGYDNVKSKGQNETSTSEIIAEQFNVSESTIKRDAKFAEGLNIIGRSNPKLKTKILTGEANVKKADVQVLSSAKNPDKLTFKNEADLYNKAKIIKDTILKDVEDNIKKIEKEKVSRNQEIIKNAEPAFLNRDDKVRKIKGMIISAINRAITEKDADAIKELKKLIDRLANELLD